jgi:hypothetical protein
VLDDVGARRPDAVGRPVDGVDDGDALLDALALGDVEPDSGLVGGPVDVLLATPSASATLMSRGSNVTGTVAPSATARLRS